MRGQRTAFGLKNAKIKELTLADYMTEEEQIEQLKNWIKQYWATVLSGIIIALIMVTCWHYWQAYQIKILTHASMVYDEMLTARAQNDGSSLANAKIQAEKLLTHYPHTPYAQLAALMLARDAAMHNDYVEADKQLSWAVDHGSVPAMREIAKIRLARFAVSANKPQAALDSLADVEDKTFMGLVDEVRGDAYLQLKDTAKAKKAYQLALVDLPKEEAAERPLLQMKLDNLTTPDEITS
jgi:predicted negative regulator of RcsB-dependent stress response